MIKKTITSIVKDVEKLESSYTAVENVKLNSHFGKQFDNFLKKLNTYLPYKLGILLLGICPI